jgi:hypothetical protein
MLLRMIPFKHRLQAWLDDHSTSRCGILMKRTAAHEPPGDVGCLQLGAFRRRMGSEIAGDRDEDMPALVGIAPLAELPHAGVQRLVGMETCILA